MGNHNYERAPSSDHSDDENARLSLENHEAKLDVDLEEQNHEKPKRPSSRAQLSFACFHFFVTFATLHIVSSPRFGYFARRKTTMREVLPLGAAMCFNVVLPNLSLAFSSVMFYQTSRILLTPVTAVLNYAFYGKTIAKQAAYTLIPICLGVGIVSYYDIKPGANTQSTSFMGVVFAMTGVVASSIYTVWIGYFHKKLELTSHQLLHNQSLCGAVMLLYFIPFIDSFPVCLFGVVIAVGGIVLYSVATTLFK
ncbi:unnamed protein product [Aureobasidium uvarum]|uniref:GDP-mannose transporter n=1 Tax=Aureobasidium uvarum TaxID=2773716 RepID=A0A9N8KMS0_9PEZI|nr:unnamed protein product [Aureobasidium uvarum]